MSTHIIGFYEKISKIICFKIIIKYHQISTLSVLVSFVFFLFFCFVVAMCDPVHDVETI